MKEVYKEAFAEVNEIFKLMPEGLLNKIPSEFKQIIEGEKSTSYISQIHEPIEECNLKEETIIILALIYRDFLCSKEEKEKLKLRDAKAVKDAEEELRERYNPDDVFKNRKSERVEQEYKENQLVVVEEKWYTKILNIIKNIFKKN